MSGNPGRETVALAAAAAIGLSEGRDEAQLRLLAEFFLLIGYSLAAMATTQELREAGRGHGPEQEV